MSIPGAIAGAGAGMTQGGAAGAAVGGLACLSLLSDSTSGSLGGPNGNCTPEEKRDLQDRVENACGAAKQCYGTDDAATLSRKIGMHSACINARRNINNRCFGGGDQGHQTAIDQRVSAIRNCQRFMTDMGR